MTTMDKLTGPEGATYVRTPGFMTPCNPCPGAWPAYGYCSACSLRMCEHCYNGHGHVPQPIPEIPLPSIPPDFMNGRRVVLGVTVTPTFGNAFPRCDPCNRKIPNDELRFLLNSVTRDGNPLVVGVCCSGKIGGLVADTRHWRKQPWRERVEDLHRRLARWEVGSEEDIRFCILALVGEVGELANLLKKEWRDEVSADPEAIGDELADVAMQLHLLARALGVDIDRCAEIKMDKNDTRWPPGGA